MTTINPEQRRTIGQLFAVGFHSTIVDDNIKSLITDYGVGAIVLFKRNVRSATQLRALTRDLQQIAKDAGHKQPLFIGIDQENGLVTRISPPIATQLPGPMALGASGSVESAHEVAIATGKILRHFGINMNYAPIGDINSEPRNPVIGTRSPGDDPNKVADYAIACAKGLREASIAPCVKHFPGHGDTAVDSHYGLPVIDKDRASMDAVELVPFKKAVAEGIEMVMTAHISLPQLGNSNLPATLSPDAMEILRQDLGFDGVVMTDCLEMDGIRAEYGTVEGSLMAFQAGVDNVMICHTYEVQTEAIDHICNAVTSGKLSQESIDKSLRRLAKLKDSFTNWEDALQQHDDTELIALNKDSKILADRVYAASATLVRSQEGLLPLSRDLKTVFISPGKNIPVGGGAADSGDEPTRVPWTSDKFINTLRQHNPDAKDVRFTDATLSEDQWKDVEGAEVVIIATRNTNEAPYQAQLALEVLKRRDSRSGGKGNGVVAIATCNPYDFLQVKEIATYCAMYEPTVEAFAAVINILYGKAEAKGQLPVAYTP